MSVTQSIVDICSERAGERRVLRVRLEVGTLAGVMPDALRFCFDVATPGTVLEGATLEIEVVPAAARCRGCGAEVALDSFFGACACGSHDLERLRGDELLVREMELEAA